jgi:hypothetical protein
MSGVFDRLSKKLGEKDDSSGISPLDLANLPQAQRQLMRILLRELEMSLSSLMDVVNELPEEQRPDQTKVEEALKALALEGWVIKMGEGGQITYKANLRRKAPSTLAQSIWSTLDARIGEAKTSNLNKDQES